MPESNQKLKEIYMKNPLTDVQTKVAIFRYGVISEALHLPAREASAHYGRQAKREFDIPYSNRRRISIATMRLWMKRYREEGYEGLAPRLRSDRGSVRSLSSDVVEALLEVRRQNMELSVRKVIELTQSSSKHYVNVPMPHSTVHRLFTTEKLMHKAPAVQRDMLRFAAQEAGQLWQTDIMHGPAVLNAKGRKRKTMLIALIDDATRLVPYAAFGFSENAAEYLKVFGEGVKRRGTPDRLLCDNGAAFRSQRLNQACGKLGTALVRARPYHAEAKGKIERWFRTVRMQFIPLLEQKGVSNLEDLNYHFYAWVEKEYHTTPHRGLNGRTPFDEWARLCKRDRRPHPSVDLEDMFLLEVERKVNKARTVSLDGRLFEVGSGLAGEKVTLRYDPETLDKNPPKVVHKGRDRGEAKRLDQAANMRIKRQPVQKTFHDLERRNKKG